MPVFADERLYEMWRVDVRRYLQKSYDFGLALDIIKRGDEAHSLYDWFTDDVTAKEAAEWLSDEWEEC